MTREEGMELIKKHEGKLPEKYLNEFLVFWGMSKDEFLKITEKFTNTKLFKKDPNGNILRNETGNIEKINYDNIN